MEGRNKGTELGALSKREKGIENIFSPFLILGILKNWSSVCRFIWKIAFEFFHAVVLRQIRLRLLSHDRYGPVVDLFIVFLGMVFPDQPKYEKKQFN